jgi:dTDP-4-amino-4,6-dideoxygalactose transaminase
MIPIYKPFLEKYKESAKEAIESEWISNHGMYVDLASKLLCDILGVKYCILMNNGTSSTHCLYKALKYKFAKINIIKKDN